MLAGGSARRKFKSGAAGGNVESAHMRIPALAFASSALFSCVLFTVACDDGTGEDERDEDEGEGAPDSVDCENLPRGPIEYDTMPGFLTAEDFAFDADGNVVGVDENGNIVRVNAAGEIQLAIPNVGDTAGIRFLPGGDVVVNIVSEGALVRYTPQ